MYEELVTALRQMQDWDTMDFNDETGYATEIIKEAAIALEELNAIAESNWRSVETWAKIATEAVETYEEMNKSKWIKFTFRPLTEREKAKFPGRISIIDCKIPNDGEEIIVSDGKWVWTDTFGTDGFGWWLNGDYDYDLEDLWWMPLPEPPKEEEK